MSVSLYQHQSSVSLLSVSRSSESVRGYILVQPYQPRRVEYKHLFLQFDLTLISSITVGTALPIH